MTNDVIQIKQEDNEEDVKQDIMKYPKCPKHQDQPATKVCKDPKCGSSATVNLICAMCICSGIHLNHLLNNVEEEFERCQNRLQSKKFCLRDSGKIIDANIYSLNRAENAHKTRSNKRKRQRVEEHFQQAKKVLDEMYKTVLRDLDDAAEELVKKCDEAKKEQESSRAELHSKNAQIEHLLGMSIQEFFADSSQVVKAMRFEHPVTKVIEPVFTFPNIRLPEIATFSDQFKTIYFADTPTFPTTMKRFFETREKYKEMVKYKGQLLRVMNAETSRSCVTQGVLIIVIDAQYLHPPGPQGSIGEMSRLKRFFCNKIPNDYQDIFQRYKEIRVGLLSPLYGVNFVGEINSFVQRYPHIHMEYIVKDVPVAEVAFEQFIDHCLAEQ